MADGILRTMEEVASWRIGPGSRQYPLVIAHRGGADLAPENTLAALRNAVALGADAAEIDVRLSRDGEAVLMHDRRVDRTTTGTGVVGTLTLEQLRALDAGSWFGPQFVGEPVPSLEEVFQALPADFKVYVEMKARGPACWALARRVVGIIRRCRRWDSAMVASFNPMAMALVRALDPRIVRGYIWSGDHPMPLRARWLSPLVDPLWYAPDRRTLTPRLLSRLHSMGKPVAAWDLDTGTDMEQLREMGLDGAVTDRPDVLLRQKLGGVIAGSPGLGGALESVPHHMLRSA